MVESAKSEIVQQWLMPKRSTLVTCLTMAAQWIVKVIQALWQMGVDSWIHRNEEFYGKTEEEQLTKMMIEVDDKIRIRYEFDQWHVQEGDKSLFLLPVEVQIKRHNIHKKHRWVESVDLAYNAWHRATQGCR